MGHLRRLRAVGWGTAAALGVVLTLASCTIPQDPDRSLERIETTKTLRAGAAHAPGWVEVSGERPSGREPELIEGFAAEHGATVTWTVAGEEELITQLSEGELDVVVAGLTAQTPWADKAGITRKYATSQRKGRQIEHVMAVPLGENRLLTELEYYLGREAGQ